MGSSHGQVLPSADVSRDCGTSSKLRTTQVGSGGTLGRSLNLYGMGPQRTLVLFNGKRLPPTSSDGRVDPETIPRVLLRRMEVITPGNSAMYGSGAISGVLNFVPNVRFRGLEINANTGISVLGDDRTENESVAWGTSLFSGRGHLLASFENRGRGQSVLRGRRPWGRAVWTVQGAGSAADPYRLIENTRIADSTFGGLINDGVLAGEQFVGNGRLAEFVHGASTGTSGFESGGDGAYYDASFLPANRLDQVFASLDYDFGLSVHGDITAFATYLNRTDIHADNQLTDVTLSAGNPFLATQYRTTLQRAGESTFQFSKVWLTVPPRTSKRWTRQYFADLEFHGRFGDKYNWDAWYSHAQTGNDSRREANINNQHLYAALDVVADPATGQPVCRVTLTNPGLDPGCVPLNVFGRGSESLAAINYIVRPTDSLSRQTMDDASIALSGTPMEDRVGPVGVELEAEWRRLTWSVVSDAQPTDPVDCSGIRFNCSPSTLLWADGSSPARSRVSQTAATGAVIVNAPLATGHAFAREVTFNGALRYSSYDTSDGAVTWEAGIDWIVGQATLRATRSVDVRAPALRDLYLPESLSSVQTTDLLTGASPVVPQVTVGNRHLVPEIARSMRIVLSYEPDWAPSLMVSLDSFWMTIAHAIASFDGSDPTIQTLCYASGGASPYCALQRRPHGFDDTSVANAVTEWFNEELSVSTWHTQGADFRARYGPRLFGHLLTLHARVAFQPHVVYSAPGLPTIDLGGVAFNGNGMQPFPVWRVSIAGGYHPIRNLTLEVTERWRSALAWTADPAQIVAEPKIASVAYTDLGLAYSFNHGAVRRVLYVEVRNLFDRQPPPGAYPGAGGAVGQSGGFIQGDDPVGTYFSVGIRWRL